MKRNPLRVLVVISDIHAGSTKAILPPNFKTLEGQPIGQSAGQEWLWAGWVEFKRWLSGIVNPKEYAVVLNGDLIEGNHHGTKEIWSPETGDHAKAAIEILAPVARRAAKTFVIRGTECHVGSSEISIARTIGAEVNPESQQPFWDRLTLDMCGVRLSVRHHFPATSRVHLEASQHSIQIGNAILEAVRAKEVPPRVIIGAHRHRPGHWDDGVNMSVVTGAWQTLTRFGFKVVPDGRPCPRVYVLDWREKEDGELPEVHSFTVTAPEAPSVSI
jgi:hypothetical protein